MKKVNHMVRPTGESAFKMRLSGNYYNYNWPVRCPSPHNKSPLNKQTLGRIFSFLHHAGSHSPEAVTRKWRDAEQRFIDRHMPWHGSSRFVNKFTAHRWM